LRGRRGGVEEESGETSTGDGWIKTSRGEGGGGGGGGPERGRHSWGALGNDLEGLREGSYVHKIIDRGDPGGAEVDEKISLKSL